MGHSEFSAPAGAKIYEWSKGSLNNAGEKIDISLPGDFDEFGTRYYIRVDRVVYDDENDWPIAPDKGLDVDGDGVADESIALERKADAEYGNDVINWQAASPSPGSAPDTGD